MPDWLPWRYDPSVVRHFAVGRRSQFHQKARLNAPFATSTTYRSGTDLPTNNWGRALATSTFGRRLPVLPEGPILGHSNRR